MEDREAELNRVHAEAARRFDHCLQTVLDMARFSSPRPTDKALVEAIKQCISLDIMDSTMLPESITSTQHGGVILHLPEGRRVSIAADGSVIAWNFPKDERKGALIP